MQNNEEEEKGSLVKSQNTFKKKKKGKERLGMEADPAGQIQPKPVNLSTIKTTGVTSPCSPKRMLGGREQTANQ